MKLLITGGAGYIGSHVVKYLSEIGCELVVLDNLTRGHREAVSEGNFICGDLADYNLLMDIMKEEEIEGVIHLAAYSLVSESISDPGLYYRNNICRGINLLEAMVKNQVSHIIYSSTAAVYGAPDELPIYEDHPEQPINAYGESKLFFEKILSRYEETYGLHYISLRYFNAAGADPEGEIGEEHDPETHLIPIVLKKALGERSELYIYGDDYPTPDGSCIRDYIHVNDLACAHHLALKHLKEGGRSGIYNLGNGSGYSVKEVIKTAEEVVGSEIEYQIGERRPGDPPVLLASSAKIKKELGWCPHYPDLKDIISTAWNWHKKGGFNEAQKEKN